MNKTNPPVAIVTGASSGIGRATAKALQQAGYRVFGTSRHATIGRSDDVTMLSCDVTDDASVEKLVDDVLAAGYRVFGTSRQAGVGRSDGVTMLTCDVTDDESVAKLVDEVLAKAGRIDLLVNNAGLGLLGAAEESSITQARALFEVNVFGVLRLTNAVLPAMRRQKSGRVINLSSVLGLIPAPYSALYASTKHAIEGYSESLDHELRTMGIRVVLVEPAYTRTSFGDNLVKPDRLLDIYNASRAGMNVVLEKAMITGDAPETVAATILKAATASVPKTRYAAGKTARQVSLLRRFVPAAAFDRSLRKQNGLTLIS